MKKKKIMFVTAQVNRGGASKVISLLYAFYSTLLLIPLAYRYILPKENAYGGKNNETVVAR